MEPKCEPVDQSEKSLKVHEDLDEGRSRNETYAGASESCDKHVD